MKILYPVIGMALCALSMSAADGYRSIAVNLTDGTKVEVDLANSLQAAFIDDAFIITGAGADVAVPKTKIQSFTFSKTTGIDGAVDAGQAPRLEGGCLNFYALAENTAVTVCNASGQVVSEACVSGNYSISLSELPRGVVFVNVNGLTYKIVVK